MITLKFHFKDSATYSGKKINILKIFRTNLILKTLNQLQLLSNKTKLNLKFFKIDESSSTIFERFVYYIESINPVTANVFSDTDVILDSSPDSTETNSSFSAPPINSKCPLYKLRTILKKFFPPLRLQYLLM